MRSCAENGKASQHDEHDEESKQSKTKKKKIDTISIQKEGGKEPIECLNTL